MKTYEKEFEILDCDCMVGKWSMRKPYEKHSPEDLKEELSYHGIKKALAFHASSREQDPDKWNIEMSRIAEKEISFIPCWIIHPEVGKLEEDILKIKEYGIRAIRFEPKAQQFAFSTCVTGDWLERFQKMKTLVFVPLEAGWDRIYEVCRDFPELRLCITDVGYGVHGNLYPLFKKFPELRISTWRFVSESIEEVCKKFGAYRLLFGSKLPFYSPGAGIGHITYSSLSRDEKSKILGKNLKILLDEVKL